MGDRHGPQDVEILFEDDQLIAAVKPAGMPTANALPGRPSLYAWLKSRPGREGFVGIVSRLDAPVSGVVVVAKTPAAAARLAAQFRDREVHKRYLAVVAGRFPAPVGDWVAWHDRIVRGQGQRPSLVLPAEGGAGRAGQGSMTPGSRAGPEGRTGEPQEASTRARVVRRAGEVSLVELEPLTGRRHQLRAQLAARGCPIVGDRRYGSRLPFPLPGGIALHAASLTLAHPAGGRKTFAAAEGSGWRQAFPGLFGPSAGG